MPYERNGKLRQDTDKTNRLRIGRTNGNEETKLQNKDWRFKNIEGPNQKTWKENLESSSDFLSLFISDKGVRSGQDTQPNIRSDTVMDQIKVSEILADQFGFTYGFTPVCYYCRWDWTIICGPIGFTNHPSVKLIEQKSRGSEKFDFQEVNSTQVKRVPESLHANKTTGHDGISAKILKAGAQETSLSLSTTRTS